MAHLFEFRNQIVNVDGKQRLQYFAKLNGPEEDEFYLGFNAKYKNNIGIARYARKGDLQQYNPDDYSGKYGFWSTFIYPTSTVESSNSFLCTNTYDRAFFTFTFLQFAAHVPNGDFVCFLREMLQLPQAADYFPKLKLINGRIYYQPAQGKPSPLESDTSTQQLMEYLNPSVLQIEEQELLCCARLVHWTLYHAEAREMQVKHGIALFQKNMPVYDRKFGLNGYPASVCLMICDILHQGRGKVNEIKSAIDTGKDYQKAFNNLCQIGLSNYGSRITGLKKVVGELTEAGKLNMVYDGKSKNFIPA